MPLRKGPKQPFRKRVEKVKPILQPREREKPGTIGYRAGELLRAEKPLPVESWILGYRFDLDTGRVHAPLNVPVSDKPMSGVRRSDKVAEIKSPSAAVRQRYHIEANVKKRAGDFARVSEEAAQLHAFLERFPNSIHVPSTRASIRRFLLTAIRLVGPRSRKKAAVLALESLVNAIHMLEANNPNALRQALFGGFTRAIKRRNELERQQLPHLPRTRQAVEATYHALRRREGAALEAAWQRVQSEGSDQAKRAYVGMLTRFARSFVVGHEYIDHLKKWRSGPQKQTIIQLQLQMVHENLAFWEQRGELHWLTPWLAHVANVMTSDPQMRSTIPLVNRMMTQAQKQNITQLRGTIQGLLEQLEA